MTHPGHRRGRLHRLDAGRPAAGRGPRGRRARRPVVGVAGQPGRGPGRPHPPADVPPDRRPRRRTSVDLIARREPRGGVPPGRPGRRAGVGGPARSRRRGQRHRHAQRARGRPAWPGTRKVVFAVERRDDLRRGARPATCRSKESHAAAPRVAVRRVQAGRPSTTCASTASCTASSSPPWRWPTSTGPGRTPTARPAWSPSSPAACWPDEAVHDLRRRRADPRLRLRRRLRRRLRAGRRPGRRPADQRRHRRRDVGQRPLRGDGGRRRRRPPGPSGRGPPRRAPALGARPSPGRHPARLAPVDPGRARASPGCWSGTPVAPDGCPRVLRRQPPHRR